MDHYKHSKPSKYPKASPGALLSPKKEMEKATLRTAMTRGATTAVHGKKKVKRQFPSSAQMAAVSARNKKRRKKKY